MGAKRERNKAMKAWGDAVRFGGAHGKATPHRERRAAVFAQPLDPRTARIHAEREQAEARLERGESRFVVRETSGHPIGHGFSKEVKPPHTSAVVLDTAYNYRLMAEYRTEDFSGPQTTPMSQRRGSVRERARCRAAELEWLYNRA